MGKHKQNTSLTSRFVIKNHKDFKSFRKQITRNTESLLYCQTLQFLEKKISKVGLENPRTATTLQRASEVLKDTLKGSGPGAKFHKVE